MPESQITCPNCGKSIQQPDPASETAPLCHYCMMIGALSDQEESLDLDNSSQLPKYLGDHHILEEIGRGGMGVIFRAKQEKLDREVALKVVLDGRLAGPESVARFLREAHSAARLNHPAITEVYETGEDQGFIYYTSRLMKGGSLKEVLDKISTTSTPDEPTQKKYLKMILRLAEGLHYGHQHGIIHRDIKPGNILLDENELAYIADFGLAKQIDTQTSQLTLSGMTAGSPSYMAPEQLEGHEATQSIDIYALGAVLYELLCGAPPFQGQTVAAIYREIQNREASFPSTSRNIHRSLQAICLKCLQKNPAQRYPSAAALAEDIRYYLEGRPIRARQTRTLERMSLWCRRRPMVAALSAILIIALFTTGILSFRNHKLEQVARIKAELQERSSRHKLAEEIMTRANELCRQQGPSEHAKLYLKAAELAHDHPAIAREALEVYSAWQVSLATIIQHTDDGSTYATYSSDGKIAVFGSNSLCSIHTSGKTPLPLHHEQRVTHADFSPDSTMIATYAEPDVYLHNADDGSLIHRFKKQLPLALSSNPITDGTSCAFSPDGKLLTIAYACEPATVYLVSNKKPLRIIPAPECDRLLGSVIKIIYSADNLHIIITYAGGCTVTNLKSGGNYFIPAVVEMLDTAISPDSKSFAVAGKDSHARTFDILTGKEISNAKHKYHLSSIAYSPNGKWLATSSRDRTARLFAISPSGTLEEKHKYRHPAAVLNVCWHPTEERLISLSEDNNLRIFTPHSSRPLYTIPAELKRARKMMLMGDGSTIPCSILIESTEGAIAKHTFPLAPTPVAELGRQVHQLRTLPDNRGIVTASNFPEQKVGLNTWTLTGKQHTSKIQPPVNEKKSKHYKLTLSLSEDGAKATHCLDTARVQVLDTSTARILFNQEVSDELCLLTATSSQMVASIDRTLILRLHQIKDGKLHSQYNLPYIANCMAFSPDGSLLALGTSERVMCFEVTDNGLILLHQQARHRNSILAIAFSPDGKSIATGSMDHEARLWHARSGKPKGLPMKHPDYVWELAFNHDGTLLATAGQNAYVHFWHTRSSLQWGAPIPQSSWVNALTFYRDEQENEKLLLAGSDFTLRSIPLPATIPISPSERIQE